MSEKTERRFERTDFIEVDKLIDFLLTINQARFDKKHHGQGLSIQEEAEYVAATEILEDFEDIQNLFNNCNPTLQLKIALDDFVDFLDTLPKPKNYD